MVLMENLKNTPACSCLLTLMQKKCQNHSAHAVRIVQLAALTELHTVLESRVSVS